MPKVKSWKIKKTLCLAMAMHASSTVVQDSLHHVLTFVYLLSRSNQNDKWHFDLKCHQQGSINPGSQPLRRLTRRKKRSFTKARKTKKPKDFQRYQHLKKATRSACKHAYTVSTSTTLSALSRQLTPFWRFHQKQKMWQFWFLSAQGKKRSDALGQFDQSKYTEWTVLLSFQQGRGHSNHQKQRSKPISLHGFFYSVIRRS